jgi:carboxypeptidase-like protein
LHYQKRERYDFACGVVLDASTKNPVSLAMVSLSTCGRGALPNTDEIDQTDSKGNFKVQAFPCNSRDYTLYISASGYKDKSVKGSDNGDFIFDTCSSNEILLEIQK